MKSEKNKPRTCIYWSTEAEKEAFEEDARRAGVTVSHFGNILLQARQSAPALLQAIRHINPAFYDAMLSGQAGNGQGEAFVREATQRAEAAERRATQLAAERDRLKQEIAAQRTTIGNLQDALRRAEERAAQARLGEANLNTLRQEAPQGILASDSQAILQALRAGRLYEEELLDALEAQNQWTRERAKAELHHAVTVGIIPPKGPDGRFGKPSPLPLDFLQPKKQRRAGAAQ